MRNTLSQTALLVALRCSCWTNSKHDPHVTGEVEQQHNAHDAGRFNKVLIDKEAMKPVRQALRTLREYHYDNSLPWDDSGFRLVPAVHYLEYSSHINQLKRQYEQEVENFIQEYPALKEQARIRLNGMYRESDYPTVSELREKFSVRVAHRQIDEPDDLRVTVQEEQVEEIKQSIRSEMTLSISLAQADIYKRIRNVISHMANKLADTDAVFRDTLVTNVSALIELLPKLNFTNDPKLDEICEEMKKLVVFEPDTLRKEEGIRLDVARKAKTILNKYYQL